MSVDVSSTNPVRGFFSSEEPRTPPGVRLRSLILAGDVPDATVGFVPGSTTVADIIAEAGGNRSPNRTPGNVKQARFLTNADRGGNAGVTAEEILNRQNETPLNIGTIIRVEHRGDWEVIYDNGSNTDPAFLRSTAFITGDQVPGDTLPVMLVPAGSQEALRAAFRAITDPEPFPPFAVGETGIFTLSGREGFYERRNNPNGVYGVPTGPRDANWREVAPPVPTFAFYQVLDLVTAKQLHNLYQVVPGRTYAILFGSQYVQVPGTPLGQFAFQGLVNGLAAWVDVGASQWEYAGPETLTRPNLLARFADTSPIADKRYGVISPPSTAIIYARFFHHNWQPGGVVPGMLVAHDAVQIPASGPASLGTYDLGADVFTPAGTSGGGALRAQCFAPSGLRTVGPFLFDAVPGPLSLKVLDNVASVSGQVNYRDPARPDIWNAGTIRSSPDATPTALAALLTALSADVAALPAPGLALGGELLLRVTPIDSSLSSSFLFDGVTAGLVSGRSMTYRQNYTGPPVGNLMPNSQFADSTIWGVTGAAGGADIAVGGGQATTVNSNAGNAVLYQFLTLAAGTYRLMVGVLSLDLGTINVDIQSPVGTTPQGGFITADGEKTFDFTVPSGQCLFQFVGMREAILNHVYLVKL